MGQKRKKGGGWGEGGEERKGKKRLSSFPRSISNTSKITDIGNRFLSAENSTETLASQANAPVYHPPPSPPREGDTLFYKLYRYVCGARG